MTIGVLVLLLSVVGATQTQAQARTDRVVTRYAVCVGVSDYIGTANDLTYCDDDAKDIRDALLADPRWNTANITLLTDSQATRANIQTALQNMVAAADADDICVFSFSGHGTTGTDLSPYDETDGVDEYICPHDFINIRDDDLASWLTGMSAATMVVFIDTCYSGGQIKAAGCSVRTINVNGPAPRKGDGFTSDLTAPNKDLDDLNFVISTACDDDELSWESSAFGNGAYTEYLLAAMGNVAADANSNGELSCEEAHAHLAPLVTAFQSTQHPQIYDGNGTPQADYVALGSGVTDDAYEENDTRTNAYDFTTEQVWLSTISGLGVQADDDWYEIEVSSGYERVQVDCQFTDADGDIDIALVNAAGATLDSSTSFTDDEYIDHVVPTSGTYYIWVHYGNAGNTYDLWWDDLADGAPQPELSYLSCVIDDDSSGTSSGNGDGTVNPGESIELTVTIANNGGADANNVSATLSTSDSYVTIADTAEDYGIIASSSSASCLEDYDFTVSSNCPNGHVITFDLAITSDEGSWPDSFTVTVNGSGNGACVRYAVVVGVSDYVGTANDLGYCDDDAKDIRNMLLTDPRWDTANIQLLLDSQATRANIQTALANMAAVADGDDICLFSFSGHGTTGADVAPADEIDGLDEYICPHDFNNIRDDELGDWLAAIHPSNMVVFIDTCHSGGQIKLAGCQIRTINIDGPAPQKGDGFAADLSARARDLDDLSFVVSTACDDDEYSYENGSLANGVYTEFLLEAMRRAVADANGNGELSCEEAHSYLTPLVVAYNSSQHPQFYDGNGAPQAEFIATNSGAIDDAYEDNDSLATAYNLTTEGTLLGNLAGLGVQADEDWYRIYVAPTGEQRVRIVCVFTDVAGDIDMQLVDAAGTILAGSYSVTDNENIDYVVPAMGMYYIRVFSGNAGNTYNLWWDDFTSVTPCWEPASWVWFSWPASCEFVTGLWHYFNPDDVQWCCDMSTLVWHRIGPSNLASGWAYFSWPYAFSLNQGKWYYLNETDTQWCFNYYMNRWEQLGTP